MSTFPVAADINGIWNLVDITAFSGFYTLATVMALPQYFLIAQM